MDTDNITPEEKKEEGMLEMAPVEVTPEEMTPEEVTKEGEANAM